MLIFLFRQHFGDKKTKETYKSKKRGKNVALFYPLIVVSSW